MFSRVRWVQPIAPRLERNIGDDLLVNMFADRLEALTTQGYRVVNRRLLCRDPNKGYVVFGLRVLSMSGRPLI